VRREHSRSNRSGGGHALEELSRFIGGGNNRCGRGGLRSFRGQLVNPLDDRGRDPFRYPFGNKPAALLVDDRMSAMVAMAHGSSQADEGKREDLGELHVCGEAVLWTKAVRVGGL
jgi:hypothetical protein